MGYAAVFFVVLCCVCVVVVEPRHHSNFGSHRSSSISHRAPATVEVTTVDYTDPIPPFKPESVLRAFVISGGGERESATVTLLRSVGFEVTVLRPPSYERNLSLTPVCRQNYAHLRAIEFAGKQKYSKNDAWKDWIWVFEDEIAANPATPRDMIQQSIIDFMQSKYANEYPLAYLAGCTIMKLTRLAHLKSGVDVSESCFLCTHAYGMRVSLAKTLIRDIQNFDPHFFSFCKNNDVTSRIPLDVVLFKLCKNKAEDGAAVVVGGKLRSPIDEHKDTQMGLFYRDRTQFQH
jgi:hypothetical protein